MQKIIMQYQNKNQAELLENMQKARLKFKPSEEKETSLLKIKSSEKHRLINEGIENDPVGTEKIVLPNSTKKLYGKNNLPNNTDKVSVKKVKYKKSTGVSSALPKPNGFSFSIGNNLKGCIYQGSISLYDDNHNLLPNGSDVMVIDNNNQVFLAENSNRVDPVVFQALSDKIDSLLVGKTTTINKQVYNYNFPIIEQQFREGEYFREYVKQSYIGDTAYNIIARSHFLMWLENLNPKKKLNFLKFAKRQNKSITYIDFVDCIPLYNLFLSVNKREVILERSIFSYSS